MGRWCNGSIHRERCGDSNGLKPMRQGFDSLASHKPCFLQNDKNMTEDIRNESEACREVKASRVGRENEALRKENAELRKKLESQIDGTSRLVADCDGWRDKYRKLLDEKKGLEKMHDDVVEESAKMSEELRELRSRLEEAENEVRSLGSYNVGLKDSLDIAVSEIERLRGRGIISRILNT